jgi:hypothetical protein
MSRLKKEYKGHSIKLRLVQFEDKDGHKETIAINGYQIDMAWKALLMFFSKIAYCQLKGIYPILMQKSKNNFQIFTICFSIYMQRKPYP